MMTEHDIRQIKELVREENDDLLKSIKEWTSDQMVSKQGYLKDQLEWSDKVIQPLRTRINALWLSLGMMSGLAAILFFLFKGAN